MNEMNEELGEKLKTDVVHANLHGKCRRCGDFFLVELHELRIVCQKSSCQKWLDIYLIRIKKARHVQMSFFDVYDLDRPIIINKTYERVCRDCGKPLKKKNGEYSPHMRYCKEHRGKGYELFDSYNFSICSKKYSFQVQQQNKELIINKIMKEGFSAKDLKYFTICEICHKLCTIYELYELFLNRLSEFKVVNVHHEIPVHTLTWENINLIWDHSNLTCLCQECHGNQDHELKKNPKNPKNPNKFKSILKYL